MNYFQVKHIKNLLAHKYFYLLLAEIWTLSIAFLCLISFNTLPDFGVKSADKYVHFTFHFGFTILWVLYLITKKSDTKQILKSVLIKVFIASLLYGIVIEIAQSLFTTTREGDVFDVLANTSGSITAVLLVLIYTSTFFKSRI